VRVAVLARDRLGGETVKSLFNVVRALMLWGWPLTWTWWDSAR
jgi:hypothetical protein